MEENEITNEEELSCDVKNERNTIERWQQALRYYRKSNGPNGPNGPNGRSVRSEERCRCVAVVDVSGSMEGRKLIAVKIGLCSLVANLHENDEISLLIFSEDCSSVSNGFVQVSILLPQLPLLLTQINANGGTAFYDAIIYGMKAQFIHYNSQNDKSILIKNVMIVLTDGEDFDSRNTPSEVERYLLSPGVPHFMFILVAVAMTSREEQIFARWLELTHCKQVSVSVRTGSSLVGIFKEMLIGRILQTPTTSNRFLQIETTELPSEAISQLTSTALNELRTQLIRPIPCSFHVHEDDEDRDELMEPGYFDDDNLSCGISRVDSMSSDDKNKNEIDLNFDFGQIRHSDIAYEGERGSEYSGSEYNHTIDDVGIERVFNNTRKDTAPTSFDSPIGEDIDQEGYPQEFYCPILHKLMRDPVICEDGHTYERESITHWFQLNQTSPLTNNVVSTTTLIPNHALRNIIETAQEQRKRQTSLTPLKQINKKDSKEDGCRIM